ncbi:PREDICTED: myosin heavy chain, cardiac muscle isoform [Tarenaya hassleriana]|uniref:myosin heavy chain, cardiac muscle isoform n=1 Tax=Tarenaya hassleriana TaxID=28532 RepID=UPI00053C434C|nr:PREDICTED: myosin heavy chain, cardiac muscle isoform [Tarenaya hassleriana]XP_010544135.1 PREDICTED: myosin heavy chain, cardiac muscle isoform [Tarenaya hassleriana]
MPSSVSLREDDPLLKDLNEKKQNFRRNVVSLAAELKEARTRLVSQQSSCSQEALSRQKAEARARKMEGEICGLQKELNKRDEQIRASEFAAEKYMKELDDIKSQLAATQATAEASAVSAESAQSQCLVLLKKLDEKEGSLKEHEDRVTKLGEQLEILQRELKTRESSQKELRDEVLKVEHEIMQALSMVGVNKNTELGKVERINKLLSAKDDEIARLRDELKIISAHWRIKTKDLEDQVENQKRNDQELKKKVLKLEFCLREARAQTRKLQKMGERSDMAIKELREQLATRKQQDTFPLDNQNFWDKSGFKIVVSMSMMMLVVFSRR